MEGLLLHDLVEQLDGLVIEPVRRVERCPAPPFEEIFQHAALDFDGRVLIRICGAGDLTQGGEGLVRAPCLAQTLAMRHRVIVRPRQGE